MKISPSSRDEFKNLPEDVKVILNLFGGEFSFESGQNYNGAEKYYDIFNDETERYVFQQDFQPADVNLRRFISWVRAGMPEGYHELYKTVVPVWTKED